MKSASAGLITLLNSDTFIMADLLTITTATGTSYRYTSADIDLVYSGNTFSSKDVRFKRGKTRVVIGVEVDTLDLIIYADQTNLVLGIPFFQALQSGALDGARVTLERTFMPAWGDTSNGVIVLFSGRVSDIELSRTEAQLTVKSDLELLNIAMPRNMYSPNCLHTLYDQGCTLLKSSFASNSSVLSGSTDRVINCGLAQANGFFDQGTIIFTSGANSGVTRNVKSYVVGILELSYPLPYTPAVGNTFTAHPGCDKKQDTCTNKFSNLPNFRGFPFIPKPEVAV